MRTTDGNPPALDRFLQSKTMGRLVLAGSVSALLLLTGLTIRDGLYFDDTFMFVRYAQNILDYGNYGWNAHEHTYGCTNIPFTCFLVLLKWSRMDRAIGLSATLLLSSLFWALLSLGLIHRILMDLVGPRLDAQRWLPGLYIASLAIAPVFAYNVTTGMDTSFSLFFNALMIRLVLRFQRHPSMGRLIAAAGCCYFVFLSRPDCGIYAVLFPVLFFIDKKMSWRQVGSFYLALGVFLVADTLIKTAYFGNPLPLPFYVKSSGFYRGYLGKSNWNAVQYSLDFLFDFGFLFIALLLTAGPRDLKRFMVFGLPLLLTLGYYFTVTQIMGFHSRYYLPSMPFFVIGAAYAFAGMPAIKLRPDRLIVPAAWCLFLLLLRFASPAYELLVQMQSAAEAAAFAMPENRANRLGCRDVDYTSGIWAMEKLIKLLPDGATVGATEYGWLSVQAPKLKFFDLCGLHDREIALHGYSDRLLSDWQPALIWMPHSDYTSLRKEILAGPWFLAHYDYYPDAVNYGVAILKSSPQHDLLRDRMIEWNCK